MRVYLASMFSTIETIREKAKELAFLGIECSSRWLQEKADPGCSVHDFTESNHILCAGTDIEDIRTSDAVVLFTVDGDTPTKRGGRHFESGYAYAIGVPLLICGPKENIFHFLPDVRQFDTFEETKAWLVSQKYLREQKHKSPNRTASQLGVLNSIPGNFDTVSFPNIPYRG